METYKDVLEAMDMDVLEYEQFGSWQGRWIALVEYKGILGFVTDYYGSCSGCDELCAIIDWDKPLSKKKLREFGEGMGYDDLRTYTETLDIASKDKTWDSEAEIMIQWVEKQKKYFPNE